MDEVREVARHSAEKPGRANDHGLIARTPRAKGSIGMAHNDHTTTQSARTDRHGCFGLAVVADRIDSVDVTIRDEGPGRGRKPAKTANRLRDL
jgi:hypothetical protein